MKMKLNAAQQQFMDAALARHQGTTPEQILYVVCSAAQVERERVEQQRVNAEIEASARALAAVQERDAQADDLRRLRAEVEASEQRLRAKGITLEPRNNVHVPAQRSGERGGGTRAALPRLQFRNVHEAMRFRAVRNLWIDSGRPDSGEQFEYLLRVTRDMAAITQ